jgi:hypothetical protein
MKNCPKRPAYLQEPAGPHFYMMVAAEAVQETKDIGKLRCGLSQPIPLVEWTRPRIFIEFLLIQQ